MSKITEHVQKLSLGAKVYLFQVDLSMFGEDNLYLTPGDEGVTTHALTHDGQVYSPYPIKAEGFEVNVDGPLPRPPLTVANTSGVLSGLVRSNDNFRGAQVTRLTTFAKFLDDGADPDPTAILARDVFIIRRKVVDDPKEGILGWELASVTDLVDTYLPNRTVVRDFCDHTYRVWDPDLEAFDYSSATCRYDGETYLDAQDQPCEASEDVCSKRLTGGCKARFGATASLPFRGFPGVARYRTR